MDDTFTLMGSKPAPIWHGNCLLGSCVEAISNKAVGDLAEFNRKVAQLKEGDTVLFLVDQGGTTIYKTLRIW